ncbi:MAG: ABC transporter substrate-binding protein [Clostridiales bacterium]|nr:ABC transporter substrate-binding protein [Candidatus Cacconaster stercorequi]
MKERVTALFLALIMCYTLCACGNSSAVSDDKTISFTDSCGRVVDIPAQIDHIAVSGTMAQVVVFALAPDKLVGIADAWSDIARRYIPDKYIDLPILGQLYGGKGDLNPETLLNSGAQVVVDVGEAKDGIAADLDALQAQTGLPFVHIDATLSSLDDTYTMLGQLLGMTDEASVLSKYCRHVYDRAVSIADRAEKVDLLYLLGDQGCNVIARNSYHSEVIDLLSNNLAVVDTPSAKGTGNETDLEQILLWDPDYILFSPDSICAQAANDPAWQQVSAIKNGHCCQVPEGPYNWMGFPPSAQRLLGMIWMTYVLYPDACGYKLYDEVAQYFRLFYHTELTHDQFDKLIANSLL